MIISKFEKSVCVFIPFFFGIVFIALLQFLYKCDAPVVKILIISFALLYMSLFCIAFLLSKLVEAAAEKKD
ncbi:hypothetical protein ACFLQL_01855 [Verrucomicrobiota bacterium]